MPPRSRFIQLSVILMFTFIVPCCPHEHIDFDLDLEPSPKANSELDAEHSRDKTPRGKLGGHCADNADCSSTPKAICFEEHCNCESGYVARALIFDDLSACFGIEGSPCRSQSEFLKIPDFLADSDAFLSELRSVYRELDIARGTVEDWANLTKYIEKLETIEKENVEWKEEKAWSCYSGTCVNGKCGPGISKVAVTMDIQLLADSGNREIPATVTLGLVLVKFSSIMCMCT